MAVYVENSGMGFLVKEGSLDQDRLLQWFKESTRIAAVQGAYYSKLFDSGLEILFRTVNQGDDLQIVGVDMHMSGRCIWQAKPLATVGLGEPLLVSLLMTNPDETCAFIADIVHAATIEKIDEDTILSLQVCAFPQAMDVYDSRQAYEQATPGPSLLEDRKLLPFNYIMARDEKLEEKKREGYEVQEKLMLACGPVLSVDKRSHGTEDTSCLVATISTEMGHLDLVFSPSQLGKELKKGAYVVASCIISADVMVKQSL
ncbi:hypothetical protein [uncultured Sphaerochaeta sp.]|uniref:hypothetical protein n=1 Tax=uncultured Sphaerochaeta sp. TaxID=886478 RepID=UPI002A0A9CA3|nr:hypothetical protein [uncultured Sphaerochaeta sp.]